MDLPRNPGNYVATGPQVDASGRVVVVIQNRAPIPVRDIRVTPVLINASGQVVQQGNPIGVMRTLGPNEQIVADTGLSDLTQEQLQALRFRVDGARVAE